MKYIKKIFENNKPTIDLKDEFLAAIELADELGFKSKISPNNFVIRFYFNSSSNFIGELENVINEYDNRSRLLKEIEHIQERMKNVDKIDFIGSFINYDIYQINISVDDKFIFKVEDDLYEFDKNAFLIWLRKKEINNLIASIKTDDNGTSSIFIKNINNEDIPNNIRIEIIEKTKLYVIEDGGEIDVITRHPKWFEIKFNYGTEIVDKNI